MERDRLSFISQIEEQRRQKAQQEASGKEAASKMQPFADRIHSLLLEHIPEPKTVETNHFPRISAFGFDGDDENKYTTTLSITIPSEQGNINVNIGATKHPSKGPGKYIIDVQDVDFLFYAESDEGVLHSKERNSSMPSDMMNVVIGQKYPTWPKWTRHINMEELNAYNELLDQVANKEGVTFKGHTPDNIEYKPSAQPTTRIVPRFPRR